MVQFIAGTHLTVPYIWVHAKDKVGLEVKNEDVLELIFVLLSFMLEQQVLYPADFLSVTLGLMVHDPCWG